MFKASKRIVTGMIPFLPFAKDESESETETEMQKRFDEFELSGIASPWERIKHTFFMRDEYGARSPNVEAIMHTTYLSLFAGALYGGFCKGQVAYVEFMRTNQATKFLTHMDAKRRLQDKVALSFIKGGAQLGWRTGLFTFLFMTTTNIIALYRNKEGIIEYSVGGTVAAMSYRSHLGWQRVLVGGILGFCLGTCGGAFSFCVLKMFGASMIDLRAINSQLAIEHDRQTQKMFSPVDADDLESGTYLSLQEKNKGDHVDKLEDVN